MTDQKEKIGKQVILPLSKAVEISVKSIKTRLGRSMITASGIVLAIAFLMSIFVSGSINKALLEKGSVEVRVQLQNLGGEEEQGKQIWLVVLSLMVCVVGIANAMLMSVTERYKEIGTMKCLGALDIFIIKLFLLESGFMGLFGSIAGALLGGLLMTIVSSINYGLEVITKFPIVSFLYYFVIAVILGTVLAVIGAIYPAYTAARMVPADAMRSEI
ncbi:MAG: FtsX-like permease family protein [bacterium]|nr:FtsX-like permease family protein [bacterium]MDO9465420.1 FtsX-like permease family protein [bacterium]